MVKNHLKRLNMPSSWQIKRKKIRWVTRPNPGAHSLEFGLSLNTLLKEVICCVSTSREVRSILQNKDVLVDGKIRDDPKLIVGLMDVVSIPKLNKHFRILFDKKGKLTVVSLNEQESKIKLSKIRGKSLIKGKTQLNLSDSRNILVDKDSFKIGDTLIIELPSQKIKDSIKLEKSTIIYLTGGKHTSDMGKVEDISKDKITYKSNTGKTYQTSKRYAFAIGKDKPLISLNE